MPFDLLPAEDIADLKAEDARLSEPGHLVLEGVQDYEPWRIKDLVQ